MKSQVTSSLKQYRSHKPAKTANRKITKSQRRNVSAFLLTLQVIK